MILCPCAIVQIYAKDAANAEKLSSTLGTGSGALDKINSELQKQGLEKSTGLDVVAAPRKSDNTVVIVGTSACLQCCRVLCIRVLFVILILGVLSPSQGW
jgi:hypothetical protein